MSRIVKTIKRLSRRAGGTRQEFTVTRAPKSTYGADGFPVNGATTTLTIKGVIQPVNADSEGGRILQTMPAAFHGSELRTIWTETQLIGLTNDNEPDTILIDGDTWTVVRVAHWIALGEEYYKAVIAKQGTP